MSGFQGPRKVMSSNPWQASSLGKSSDDASKTTGGTQSSTNNGQHITTYTLDPLMNALYQNPKSIASSSNTLIDEFYSETQAQQALGHEIPLTVPTKSKHLHMVTLPHSCTIRHRDVQTDADLYTVYNVTSNYWFAIEQHTISLVDSDLKVCAYFSPVDHIRKMLHANPDIRDNLPDPVRNTLQTALDYSEFCSFEAITTHSASNTVFLSIGTVVLCYRLTFTHVVTDKKTHYVTIQEDEISDVSSDVVLSSISSTGVMTVETPPSHFNSYLESDQYIYKTLGDLYKYERKHAYQPNIKRKTASSSSSSSDSSSNGDDNVVFIGGLWSLQFITAIDTASHRTPSSIAPVVPAQVMDIVSHNVYAYAQSDSKPNHLSHALVVPMILVVTPLHILSYTLYNHVLLLQYILPGLLSPPRIEQIDRLRSRTLALMLSYNQYNSQPRAAISLREQQQHGHDETPSRPGVFGFSIGAGARDQHGSAIPSSDQHHNGDGEQQTPLFLLQYPTKVQTSLSPSGLWLAIATLHVVFMVKIPHKFTYTYASTSAYYLTHRYNILPAMVSTLAMKSHIVSVKFNPTPRLFDDLIMVLCEDGDLLVFTQDRDKYSSAYQVSPIAGRGIGNTMHSFSFESIQAGLSRHHHELNLNPVSCVIGPYLDYQTVQHQQQYTHLTDSYDDDFSPSFSSYPVDAPTVLLSPYPIPSSGRSAPGSKSTAPAMSGTKPHQQAGHLAPFQDAAQGTSQQHHQRGRRHPIMVVVQHDLDAISHYLNYFAIDNLTDIHDFSTNVSATSGVGSSRRCVGVSFPWVTLHHQSSTVSTDMNLITQTNQNATRYLSTHNYITRSHDDDSGESTVQNLLESLQPTDVKAIVQHSKRYRGDLYDAIEVRNEQHQQQAAFFERFNAIEEKKQQQAGTHFRQSLASPFISEVASSRDDVSDDNDYNGDATNTRTIAVGSLALQIDSDAQSYSQGPQTPSVLMPATPSVVEPYSSHAGSISESQSQYHDRARRQQQQQHLYHLEQQQKTLDGSTFVAAAWVRDTPYHRNHEHSTKPPQQPGPHYVQLHPETTPILPVKAVAGILRSICGRSNVKALLSTLGCYGNPAMFQTSAFMKGKIKSTKEQLEEETWEILNSSYFTNDYNVPNDSQGMGGAHDRNKESHRNRAKNAARNHGMSSTDLEALDDMVSIIALIPLLVEQSYSIDETMLQNLALHVADAFTKDPNVDYADWISIWLEQVTKEINNLGNHQILHVDQKIRTFIKDNDEYYNAKQGEKSDAETQTRLNDLENKIVNMDEHEYVIGVEYNSIVALNILRSISQLLLLTTIDRNRIYHNGTIFGTSSYWPIGVNNASISNILDIHHDMIHTAKRLRDVHRSKSQHSLLWKDINLTYDVTLFPVESIIPMQMYYDESTSHLYQLFNELLESLAEVRHTSNVFAPLLSQQQDLARTSYSVLPYLNEQIFRNVSYPTSNYVSVDCNGSLTYYHLKHLHSFKEYPYFEQYHQSQQQMTMSQQQNFIGGPSYGGMDSSAQTLDAQQQTRISTNYQHVKMCTYGSRCESLSLFTINKMQNAAECIDLYVVDSNFLSVLDGFSDGVCNLHGDEQSASTSISALVLARPISLLLYLQSRTSILQKVSANKFYHHTNPGAIDGIFTGTNNSNVRIEGQLISCTGGVALKPTQNMIPIALFSRVVPSQPYKIPLHQHMTPSTMTSVLFYQVDYIMQRLFRLLNNKELKQPLTTRDNMVVHHHHAYSLLLVDGVVSVILSQQTNLAKHSLASNAQIHSQIHPYPRHPGVVHLFYSTELMRAARGELQDTQQQQQPSSDQQQTLSLDLASISSHKLSHISNISTVYDDRMLLSCLSYIFVDDTNYTSQFYKGFRPSFRNYHDEKSDGLYTSRSHQIAARLQKNDPLKYLIYRKIMNIFPSFNYGPVPIHQNPSVPLTLSPDYYRLPSPEDLLNRTIFEYTGCTWISTNDISVLTVALSSYLIFWNAAPIATSTGGGHGHAHADDAMAADPSHTRPVYHLVIQPIVEIKTCNFGLKQTHWSVSTRFCSGSPVAFDPLAIFTSNPSSLAELLSPIRSTASSFAQQQQQQPSVSEVEPLDTHLPALPIPSLPVGSHPLLGNLFKTGNRSSNSAGVSDATREISIMQLFTNNLLRRCTPIMIASCTTNDQNTIDFDNERDVLARALYHFDDLGDENPQTTIPRNPYERTHLILTYEIEIINYYLNILHHNGLSVKPSAGTIHSVAIDAGDYPEPKQNRDQSFTHDDYSQNILKRQPSLLPAQSFVALPHLTKTQKELLKQQVHRHRSKPGGDGPDGKDRQSANAMHSNIITTTVTYVEYSRISTDYVGKHRQYLLKKYPRYSQCVHANHVSRDLHISACVLVGQRDTPSPFNLYYAPCMDYHVVLGDSLGHVHLIPLTDFITNQVNRSSNLPSSSLHTPTTPAFVSSDDDQYDEPAYGNVIQSHQQQMSGAALQPSNTSSGEPPGTGSSVDSIIDPSYVTHNSMKFIAYHNTPILFIHTVSLTTIITIARNTHSFGDHDYYQFTIWKPSHVGYSSKFTCSLPKSTFFHACGIVKSYNGLSNVVIPGVNPHQIAVLTETPSTTYEICNYITLGHIGCHVQSILATHHGHLFVLCRLGPALSMKILSTELISFSQLNMFNEVIKRQQETQSLQLQQSQNYLALLNSEQARVDDELTLRVNSTTLSSASPLPLYHPVSLIEDIRSGSMIKARNILAHLHVQLLDLFGQIYDTATSYGTVYVDTNIPVDDSSEPLINSTSGQNVDPLVSALCPPHLMSQLDPSLTSALDVHNQYYASYDLHGDETSQDNYASSRPGGSSDSGNNPANKRLQPKRLPRVQLCDHSLGLPPTEYIVGGHLRSNQLKSASGNIKDIYDGFPHDVILPLYDDVKHATRLRFTVLNDLFEEEEVERVTVHTYSHPTSSSAAVNASHRVQSSSRQPQVKSPKSAFDSSSSGDDTQQQQQQPPFRTPKVKSAFDSSSSDDDDNHIPPTHVQPQAQQVRPKVKSAFDSSSSDDDAVPVQPVPQPTCQAPPKVRSAFDSSSSDDDVPAPLPVPSAQPVKSTPRVRSAFDSSSSDDDDVPSASMVQVTPPTQKQQPAPPIQQPRKPKDHHNYVEDLRHRLRSMRKPLPIYVDVDVLQYTPLHALELVQMLTGQAVTYHAISEDLKSTATGISRLGARRFQEAEKQTASTVLEKVSEGFFATTSGSILSNVILLPGLSAQEVRCLICLVISFALTSYLDVYRNCIMTPRTVYNLAGKNYTNIVSCYSQSYPSTAGQQNGGALGASSPSGKFPTTTATTTPTMQQLSTQTPSEWVFETHQSLYRPVLEDGQVDSSGWKLILLATTTLLMQTEAFKHKNMINVITEMISNRKIEGYSSNASNLAEKTKKLVTDRQHLVMPYDLTESVSHVYQTISDYNSEQQAARYLRLSATDKSYDLSKRVEHFPFDAFIDLPDCNMFSLPITSVVYGLNSLTKPELIAHLLTIASGILRTASNAIHLVNNVEAKSPQLPSVTMTIPNSDASGRPIVKDKPAAQLFVEYMQFFSSLRSADDVTLTSSTSPFAVVTRLAIGDGQPLMPPDPLDGKEQPTLGHRRRRASISDGKVQTVDGFIQSKTPLNATSHSLPTLEQTPISSIQTLNITPEVIPNRQPSEPITTDVFSLSWPVYRSLGIGYLLAHEDITSEMTILHAQLLASSSFAKTNSAAESLLWLVAINKMNELLNLLKADPSMSAAHNFLRRDFSLKENQEKAIENGFNALQRQKYHTAAAFFLLGERYADAVKCLVRNAKDLQLALFIARLLDGRGIKVTVDDADGRYSAPYAYYASEYYRTTLTRYHKAFNLKDQNKQFSMPHRNAASPIAAGQQDAALIKTFKTPLTISIFQYAIIEEILPFAYRNNLHWIAHLCYLYLQHLPAALASLLMLDSNFYRGFYQQRFHILTPNESREDGSAVFSVHEVFKRFKSHDLSCGHYIISLLSAGTVDMTDFQAAYELLDRVFSCSALQSSFDFSKYHIERPIRRMRLCSRLQHIEHGILLFQHLLFSSAQIYSIRRLPFHAFDLLHNIQLAEITLNATRTAEYNLQLIAFDFSKFPRHCIPDLDEEYDDIISAVQSYKAYTNNLQSYQRDIYGLGDDNTGRVNPLLATLPTAAAFLQSSPEMNGHILRLSPYMYVYNHYTTPNTALSSACYSTPSTERSPQLITVRGCRPLSVVHRYHNVYYLNTVITTVQQILALTAVAKPHTLVCDKSGVRAPVSSKVMISHLINKNGQHYHTNTSTVSQWIGLFANKTPILYDSLLFAAQMHQISRKHIQSLVHGAAESRRSILTLIWLLTGEVDSLAKCSSSLTCVSAIIQAHVDTSTNIGAYMLDLATLCTSVFKALYTRQARVDSTASAALDQLSNHGDQIASQMTALGVTQRVISLVPPEYRSLLPLLFVLHEISTTLTAVITNRTLSHFPALLGLLPISVPSNATHQGVSGDQPAVAGMEKYIYLLSSPSLLTALTYKHRDVGVYQSEIEMDPDSKIITQYSPSSTGGDKGGAFSRQHDFIRSFLPSEKSQASADTRRVKFTQCAAKFISVQHFLSSHSSGLKKILTQPRTLVLVHALKHTQSLLAALIFIRFCEYKCRSLYTGAGYYSPKRLITPSILSSKIVYTDPSAAIDGEESSAAPSSVLSSPQHVKLTRYIRDGVSRSISYCLRSLKYCTGHLVRHVRTSLFHSLHLLHLQKQHAQLQRLLPKDTGDVDHLLYKAIAVKATNHLDNAHTRRSVHALKAYNALNIKEYDRSIYDNATDKGLMFDRVNQQAISKIVGTSPSPAASSAASTTTPSATSSYQSTLQTSTTSSLLARSTQPFKASTGGGFESSYGFFSSPQPQPHQQQHKSEKYFPANSLEAGLIALGVKLEQEDDKKRQNNRRNSFAQDLVTIAPPRNATTASLGSGPGSLSGLLTSNNYSQGFGNVSMTENGHGSHLLPALESDGLLSIPIAGALPVTANLNSMAHAHAITFTIQSTSHKLNSQATTNQMYHQHDKTWRRFYYQYLYSNPLKGNDTTPLVLSEQGRAPAAAGKTTAPSRQTEPQTDHCAAYVTPPTTLSYSIPKTSQNIVGNHKVTTNAPHPVHHQFMTTPSLFHLFGVFRAASFSGLLPNVAMLTAQQREQVSSMQRSRDQQQQSDDMRQNSQKKTSRMATIKAAFSATATPHGYPSRSDLTVNIGNGTAGLCPNSKYVIIPSLRQQENQARTGELDRQTFLNYIRKGFTSIQQVTSLNPYPVHNILLVLTFMHCFPAWTSASSPSSLDNIAITATFFSQLLSSFDNIVNALSSSPLHLTGFKVLDSQQSSVPSNNMAAEDSTCISTVSDAPPSSHGFFEVIYSLVKRVNPATYGTNVFYFASALALSRALQSDLTYQQLAKILHPAVLTPQPIKTLSNPILEDLNKSIIPWELLYAYHTHNTVIRSFQSSTKLRSLVSAMLVPALISSLQVISNYASIDLSDHIYRTISLDQHEGHGRKRVHGLSVVLTESTAKPPTGGQDQVQLQPHGLSTTISTSSGSSTTSGATYSTNAHSHGTSPTTMAATEIEHAIAHASGVHVHCDDTVCCDEFYTLSDFRDIVCSTTCHFDQQYVIIGTSTGIKEIYIPTLLKQIQLSQHAKERRNKIRQATGGGGLPAGHPASPRRGGHPSSTPASPMVSPYSTPLSSPRHGGTSTAPLQSAAAAHADDHSERLNQGNPFKKRIKSYYAAENGSIVNGNIVGDLVTSLDHKFLLSISDGNATVDLGQPGSAVSIPPLHNIVNPVYHLGADVTSQLSLVNSPHLPFVYTSALLSFISHIHLCSRRVVEQFLHTKPMTSQLNWLYTAALTTHLRNRAVDVVLSHPNLPIYCTAQGDMILFWHLHIPIPFAQMQTHQHVVISSMSFTPDGNTLVATTNCGRVYVYQHYGCFYPANTKVNQTWGMHIHSPSVTLQPYDCPSKVIASTHNTIITISNQGLLKVWQIQVPLCICLATKVLPSPISSMTYISHLRWLVAGTADGLVYVIETLNLSVRQILHLNGLNINNKNFYLMITDSIADSCKSLVSTLISQHGHELGERYTILDTAKTSVDSIGSNPSKTSKSGAACDDCGNRTPSAASRLTTFGSDDVAPIASSVTEDPPIGSQSQHAADPSLSSVALTADGSDAFYRPPLRVETAVDSTYTYKSLTTYTYYDAASLSSPSPPPPSSYDANTASGGAGANPATAGRSDLPNQTTGAAITKIVYNHKNNTLIIGDALGFLHIYSIQSVPLPLLSAPPVRSHISTTNVSTTYPYYTNKDHQMRYQYDASMMRMHAQDRKPAGEEVPSAFGKATSRIPKDGDFELYGSSTVTQSISKFTITLPISFGYGLKFVRLLAPNMASDDSIYNSNTTDVVKQYTDALAALVNQHAPSAMSFFRSDRHEKSRSMNNSTEFSFAYCDEMTVIVTNSQDGKCHIMLENVPYHKML